MEPEEDILYNTSYCLSSTEFRDSFELSFGSTPASSPCSPSFPPVPSGTGLKANSQNPKPGNAFSQFRVFQDCGRPQTSDANPSPPSFFEFADRYQEVRKISSMDFPVRTAIPRPSTRPSELDSPKTPVSASFDEGVRAPAIAQDRAVTEPTISMARDTPDHENLHDLNEGKKKSRFNIIKSKLSFKDLRKESSKQEPTKEGTSQSHRVLTRGAVPTPSLAVHGKKPNPSRGVKISQPTIVPSNTENPPSQVPSPITSQLPQPTSRIPLPPSGTLSNVQGTSSRSRRTSGNESRAKNTPDFTAIKDKLESAAGPPTRTLPRRPATAISRPSTEIPGKKSLPKKPLTAHAHHAAKDSTPILPDPALKEGNVKSLAKNFVEEPADTPSEVQSKASLPSLLNKDESLVSSLPKRFPSDIQPKASMPTLHSKDEPLASSLPRRLPSFQERLDRAATPHDQGKQLEIQGRTTVADVNSVMEKVQTLQSQLEVGTTTMNRKLEDLSNWIGDQLNNQIQSSSDLSRTNTDLFTKQCQLSREIMKFQIDIRLEISAMEQKLVSFENRVVDDLQDKMRSLARAYEELNEKTNTILEKISFDGTQAFIEYQALKNAEIEREIAYLKARQSNLISADIAPFAVSQRVPTRRSLSTHGSREPLIRATSPAPVLSYENIQMASGRGRAVPSMENKPLTPFPRSVSITKKGLFKGIKDITSGSSDVSKEKSPEPRKPSEETKKWTMFGLRRRRNASDNAGKFSWSSHPRRGKEIQSPQDATSSRSSSPPIPPIPRSIPRGRDYPIPSFASEDMHPAFRGAAVTPFDQSTMYDPGAEDLSLQGDLDRRISDASSDTFGHFNPRLRPSYDRSRFTEELSPTFPDQSAHTPDTVIHRTLTGEGQEQNGFNDTAEQEWDHVSVQESKTDENIAH